ncbi:MAG: SDR family NAD(P)-dependent oxidoreductase [Planctomycetota bacterium]
MEPLKGKVVAVTGGGTGIGAGIATALAHAGCRVAIGGRRLEKLHSLASTVTSDTPLFCHELDVADAASIDAFFKSVRDQFGDPEILVNSAGINIQNRTMAEMAPDDWERVLKINATGAYRCIHSVLPAMRAKKDGLVINISSVGGKRAISLAGVVYCASKFAMTALGTAISNEVRDEGVRITNVYPGEVNTPILDQRPNPVSEDHKAAILQPEDIASVIVSICALPPRANVPEIVIKPTTQEWV